MPLLNSQFRFEKEDSTLTTNKMEVIREIPLTENECGQLADMLIKEANRCSVNANNCLQGYGSVTSKMKADKWNEKADELTALANKLSEPWM